MDNKVAATTYDQIITCYIINCKVNRELIPSNQDVLKEWIDNAVKYYNNIIKPYKEDFNYPLKCDKDNEIITPQLTDDEELILANVLKLVFLKNELTSFVTTYAVFQKEFGINNYKAQADMRQQDVSRQEKEITRLITNTNSDSWDIY